jgi:hypothetical protein
MPSDQTFGQQLQPHVGSLVRVRYDDGGASSLNGKIGLLMSATDRHAACTSNSAVVEVFIEERVRSLLLYSHEIELLGAVDAR